MPKTKQPTSKQLLSVIQTQTAIAKLGLDINAVMTLVAEQVQLITNAKGAIVELAEEGDMVLSCRFKWCKSISRSTLKDGF